MNKEHLAIFLEKFKSKNQERYDILRMGIFGSAARGTNAEHSDVDVVSYREGMNRFLKKRELMPRRFMYDHELVLELLEQVHIRRSNEGHHRPPLF